jgi:hypothetical protein
VTPQTGRVRSTASGSAVDGSAGVYVVRGGVALGLDQGANGDAWGYDIAAQRVTLTSAALPWPHYFVDLSGVGGSADPASNLVVISACTQLAPTPSAQPTLTSPSATATATPAATTSTPATSTASPPTVTPSLAPSTAITTPGTSTTAASPGNPASSASAPTSGISPSPATTSQGCLHPELVALNL